MVGKTDGMGQIMTIENSLHGKKFDWVKKNQYHGTPRCPDCGSGITLHPVKDVAYCTKCSWSEKI
jgi:hypothetical protein